MELLRDQDIRKVLVKNLTDKYISDSETKIVNEMGILHGRSRVDVAVINGIIHGFEIKSESDNLKRLPKQIHDYNLVFDRVTIIVQRNYLKDIRQMVPKWWGIMLVTRIGENINIREIRKGKLNPNVNVFALTHLLWKEEALSILKEKGQHKGYLSKPRKQIYERLIECVDLDELKNIIFRQLRSREGWLAD